MEERIEKNKRMKIIFLIILFVLVGLCLSFIIIFSLKYGLKDAASIGIIGGADSPTAIYISEKQNRLNILLCSLTVVIFDIIIFSIIKKIGNKRQKSLLGLNILTVMIFNLLAAILFPSAAIILFIITVIMVTALIMKTIYCKRNN